MSFNLRPGDPLWWPRRSSCEFEPILRLLASAMGAAVPDRAIKAVIVMPSEDVRQAWAIQFLSTCDQCQATMAVHRSVNAQIASTRTLAVNVAGDFAKIEQHPGCNERGKHYTSEQLLFPL